LIRCPDDSRHSSRDPVGPTIWRGEPRGPSAKPRGSLSASAAPSTRNQGALGALWKQRAAHRPRLLPCSAGYLGRSHSRLALVFLGPRWFPEPHLPNFGKSPELRSSSISRSALFVPLLKMLRTSRLSPRTSRAARRLPRAGQRKARPEKASRGGLGSQPRRVVVSSMPILPTGRVAVEWIGEL
jgi:hypothetical protein